MEISNKKGLIALTVEDEQKELKAVNPTLIKKPRLILQYLKGSKRMMGLALWNVIYPQVPGYTYGANSGVPTFSLDTLKQKGLL